jgi:outer membrane protein OmpA-like peptidoglycan-associated protein
MVKRDKKLSLFFYPDIYNKLYIMIKQTWEISNDERNRILSLHESATKNLYLMSEQTNVEVWNLGFVNYILKQGDKYFARVTPEDLIQIPTDLEISGVIQKKNNPSPSGKFKIVPTELTQNGIDVGRRMARYNPIGPIEQVTTPIPFCYFDTGENVPVYAAITFYGSFYGGSMIFPDQVEIKEREGNVVTFMKNYTDNFIIELRDIQTGTPGRNPEPEIIEPENITKTFDIESPFEFDKTDLTPDAETSFKEFIENIKKFYSNVSGDVTVTTSASIDSDPATKEQYNMELSKRRAQAIIDRLKRETGNTTLKFIPNPIGQTDKFAPDLKWPEVKDSSKTAPNRRLIIKLPEISMRK